MLYKISELKDNWNGYGTSKFSEKLIDKAYDLLILFDNLKFEIFPTANNSIQIELENEKNDYIEFEIFEDHIKVYIETKER